jgi:hypothetical protein
VFGGASLLLDGTGDYATTPDSDDWYLSDGSNANSWTVDFRVRFNADPGTASAGFIQQRADNNNFWSISLINNNLNILARVAGSNIINIDSAWNPASATWYHVAFVKQGTTGYKGFINGTQIGTTTTDIDPLPNIAGILQIGNYINSAGTNNYLNGWMDELRISKGIARWTANFTPPTSQYEPPPGRFFSFF